MPAHVRHRQPGEPLLDEDIGVEPLIIIPLDDLDYDLIDGAEPGTDQ
jgi:hypothetical protein